VNKRRRNTPGTITQRAVSLFRYGLQLEREGKTDTDLFKKVDLELSRELPLPPWCPSVYEVGIGRWYSKIAGTNPKPLQMW
jgi:hypothetical protein